MKKYYVKLNKENVITDLITFPYMDYVEFNYSPFDYENLTIGCWKLENDQLIELEELNPNNDKYLVKVALDEYTKLLIDIGLI